MIMFIKQWDWIWNLEYLKEMQNYFFYKHFNSKTIEIGKLIH